MHAPPAQASKGNHIPEVRQSPATCNSRLQPSAGIIEFALLDEATLLRLSSSVPAVLVDDVGQGFHSSRHSHYQDASGDVADQLVAGLRSAAGWAMASR